MGFTYISRMPMNPEDIISRVKAALPDAEIELVDTAGDRDHYAITVTSATFAGKLRVAQHRMVMDALGTDLGTTLHALAITTKMKS